MDISMGAHEVGPASVVHDFQSMSLPLGSAISSKIWAEEYRP